MMEELLNLDNLSQEEKDKILGVLQKDEMVRQAEDKKICQLKSEIQAIRMKSVLRAGDDLSKMCARCHTELGLFFNRGDLCPNCRFRVCNMCKENLFQGKWLCVLCYKQRQLKFFTGDYSSGQLTRWPSGGDLVKASIHKLSVFKGTSSDSEILDSPSPKKEVKNRKAVSNGSVQSDTKDKKEKVEFPQESDQKKLNQLFDAFRVPKAKDLSNKSHSTHSTVRRVTSQKYEDSTSDSESSVSTDTEKEQEVFRKDSVNVDSVDSVSKSVTASNGVLNSSKNRVPSERKLQRNFSDDSDQTLLSDEVPFSKSSTETQIKVDIHSDESNSPTLSLNKKEKEKVNSVEEIVKSKSPRGNMKQTATEVIMAMKMGSPSMSPNQNHPGNSKLVDPRRYQPGRSPSPYSFDSIPSSHANSPLPVKRHDSHLSRESSDTDSTSRMSAADYSGTESSQVRESSSGAEDYVVEEISKIRFRRMSKKIAEKGRTPKGAPTRLSPRASSEGSGSLEDSGHVSGTSTENTPEHRRTDSAVSQLSVPSSTLSTVTDRSSEETDIDDLVASHRSISVSSRGNLLSTIADSRESILSFYSNAGEVDYGKIPVTGEICFGLEYNYRTGTLEIQIKQCKGLATADPKRNRSDPYVKTYLLPDKTRGGKRKTRIIKNTLNPVFEQTLRYLISKSELENRTLWVTVWHNDRFGRNDFLGEVTINFDYFRFGDSSAKWYPLQERIESVPAANLTYKGDLFLSIKYVPAEKVRKEDTTASPSKKKFRKGKSEVGGKGQLHVLIKEARNLTAVRSGGFSDPFVKGYLLPDKQRGLKQKTGVVKRNCNPHWEHTFIFEDVNKTDLKERCLELTVWDHDKLSSNEFLGGLRLNLGVGKSFGKLVDWMDAHGEEISLWQAMLDRPNIWIDGALMLRPNMDKRKY